MATTSLWHIEGRLKDLIAYVENPEKTRSENPNLQPLWDVFSYVSRPEATEQGEYVSSINCLKEIALQQMILTKKQYGKENGYIAWHGYQSFKPGEVTPEQAHKIGLQLAKEMWGDRFQIIVTTHLDKDHLHNHFCFNSVSFLDGKKYNYSKTEQRKLREVSDRICREHGLSVIENPHKAPSRQVWLDEKSGKPTRYNVYREDVKEAINFSRRPYYNGEVPGTVIHFPARLLDRLAGQLAAAKDVQARAAGAYLRIAVKPLHPCRRPCIQLAALYAVVEVHADDTAAVELKAHALIMPGVYLCRGRGKVGPCVRLSRFGRIPCAGIVWAFPCLARRSPAHPLR